MTELIIALLMIVNGEIKEHRIQQTMSECLKGKRVAMRDTKKSVEHGKNGTQKYVIKQGENKGKIL